MARKFSPVPSSSNFAMQPGTPTAVEPPVPASSSSSSSRRSNANVIFLGLGFMFTISATWTSSIIIESVIQPLKPPNGTFVGNEGYLSISITFLVQVGSPLFSLLALRLFGLKLAMVLAGLQSALYCATFLFYPVPWLVYVSSVLLGIGQGVEYSLLGIVITQATDSAAGCDKKAATKMTRNVGLFWILYSFSIWGDLYASWKFRESHEINGDARVSVYTFLLILALCGCVMFGLIKVVKPTTPTNTDTEHHQLTPTAPRPATPTPTPTTSFSSVLRESLYAPLATLKQRETVYLLLPSLYIAVTFGFYSAAFPASVGFTKQFGANVKTYMSLSALMLGLGNISAGIVVSSRLAKHVSRTTFMCAALVAHSTAYLLTFITLPYDSPFGPTDAASIYGPYPACILLAGFLLGVGDGCAITQLLAAMSDVYGGGGTTTTSDGDESAPHKNLVVPAFALCNSVQCGGIALVTAYSAILPLPYHFVIIMPIAVAGVVAYAYVNRMLKRKHVPQHHQVPLVRVPLNADGGE